MAVVDLPGDSVVRILHLLCRWPKFNSWWGNSGQKSGGRVGGGEGIKKKMPMVTEEAEVEAVSFHHFGW